MDWQVMYFDDEGDFISQHFIYDRTEHEAEKEASADMPLEAEDWTLIPLDNEKEEGTY